MNTDAIVRTAERLNERITDRFDGRGISRLAAELVGIAAETERRVHDLRRPRWWIRVAAVLIVVGGALEYCSEMLSLTNKLAALYAQDSQDGVVLGAVRDVQELAGLLSGRIWQKIVILDTLVATDRPNQP